MQVSLSPNAHESYAINKRRLLEIMRQFAFEKREVTLASGQKSNVYLDCRQVYFRGEAQHLIGELFYTELCQKETNDSPFAGVGGMALGAAPLASALSIFAFRAGRELPGVIVRKQVKDHGTKASVEGLKSFQKGDRVFLLEDVVTTGGSTIKAAQALRDQGLIVESAICLVCRDESGKENLSKEQIDLKYLFELKDFTG